ncbi:hypothetical protein OF83DRAFT_1273158 [Amylostereum chailletii]|nr:hypothetical protein OF83DRAFT_1273158 [Amylostereum chailletii]
MSRLIIQNNSSTTSQAGDELWLSFAHQKLQDALAARTGQGHDDTESVILERELQSVDIVRKALLHRRNALRPACRIPAELLSHIFGLLCVDWCPGEEQSSTNQEPEPADASPNNLGWIVVTHVCRRWRQVALSTAILWSNINCRLSERWATEMFTRARNSPATYVIDEGDSVEHHRAILSQHLSHLKEISGIEDRHATTSPAPLLESFDWEMDSSNADVVSLPPNMFAGHAPRLRSLNLDCVVPPWNSLAFRNLDRLCIGIPQELITAPLSSLQPDYHSFYDFLESMPGLNHLCLVACLPSYHLYPAADRRVKFPNLKTVELQGLARDCAALVHRIEAPTLEEMNAHFVVSEATDQDIIYSMDSLSRHMRIRVIDDTPSHVHVLRFISSGGGGGSLNRRFDVRVQAWPVLVKNMRDLTDSSTTHFPRIGGFFCASTEESTERFYTVLTQAIRALPLDKADALILCAHPVWTPPTAANFASYIPSTLPHLVLQGWLDPHISRALVAPIDGTPALPYLKTLTFCNMRMAIPSTKPLDANDLLPVEIVAKRQRQYTPLEKVYVSDCTYKPEVIDELAGHVAVERRGLPSRFA